MPFKQIGILIGFAIFLLISGCAGKGNLFVLVPDPDGMVGKIAISNPAGTQVLDKAGQATYVEAIDRAPKAPIQMDVKEIDKIFAPVLAAQPEAPVIFLLYFKAGTSDLTDESQNLLPQIIRTIQERRSVDTSVVGHTDTVGNADLNAKLSHQRAVRVAKFFTDSGIDPDILEITSHGETNLLVKTPDNTDEPRNRRVAITVR
ncbi:MAG: OmpA family protein [Desulfobacterales bacterium]